MDKKLLVIGAHSADFIWRAAGSIAKTVEQGGLAKVVSLSYGERGESGNLWKENPTRSLESVKKIRHEQAQQAATIVGAEFVCFDLGDYPLVVNRESLERLSTLMREFAPNVILTHTAKDPFNPDHPLTHEVVQKARLLASGANVQAAFKTITPPVWYCFEPHQPELCEFMPNTFIDITSVFAKKVEAMAVMGAQSYLKSYYTELGARRGNHARRISGKNDIQYAEAHMRLLPLVASSLFDKGLA